jgi:hypothetical protein
LEEKRREKEAVAEACRAVEANQRALLVEQLSLEEKKREKEAVAEACRAVVASQRETNGEEAAIDEGKRTFESRRQSHGQSFDGWNPWRTEEAAGGREGKKMIDTSTRKESTVASKSLVGEATTVKANRDDKVTDRALMDGILDVQSKLQEAEKAQLDLNNSIEATQRALLTTPTHLKPESGRDDEVQIVPDRPPATALGHQQPKSRDAEKRLKVRYSSMSLAELAFARLQARYDGMSLGECASSILDDMGMVAKNPNPQEPDYDLSKKRAPSTTHLLPEKKRRAAAAAKAVALARQQPKSYKEAIVLKSRYAAMSPEDRAFEILNDLGMVEKNPNPNDPGYDHSKDDKLCLHKEAIVLKARYDAMSPEDRAFAILNDLGMVEKNPNPSDPGYDHSNDDTFCL